MKHIARRRFFEQALGASATGALGGTVLVSSGTMPPLVRRAQASEDGLEQATLEGVSYFSERNQVQIEAVEALRTAIASGDLAAARQAYIDARPPYEEIETLAASFEDSDADIDARPYSFDGGETSEDFRGFHKIEYLLFRDDDLDLAAQFADTLAESAQRLQQELGDPERFHAAGTFEGMIGLAEEIGSKKISSEEETWSDQSMLIFKHNIIGIFSQYQPFAPHVAKLSEQADSGVSEAYQAFRAVLEPFDEGEGAAMVPYSQIKTADRKAISDATYGLRDALIVAAVQLKVI